MNTNKASKLSFGWLLKSHRYFYKSWFIKIPDVSNMRNGYVLKFNVVLLAIYKMYLSIRWECCYGDNCMSNLGEEVGRELYSSKEY